MFYLVIKWRCKFYKILLDVSIATFPKVVFFFCSFQVATLLSFVKLGC